MTLRRDPSLNQALRRSQAHRGRSDGSAQQLADNQTPAQPYLDLVRQGIGMPGSSRRQPGSQPAGASGRTP